MPSQPLVAAYDGLVCDLDGVVYRGAEAVPGAPEALQALRTRGVRIVYATNNASRVPAEVATQLASLGAPASAGDVVTSAQAGAARLAALLPPRAVVLALGGDGVVEALEEVGLVPALPTGPDDSRTDDAAAVLQGYGRQLRVEDFDTAARLLTTGLPWVATNADATLPLPWGQSPGNGAYVEVLATATRRRPEVVGKPHPPLYALAAGRLGSDPHRTLAVGDRLGTDVVGAAAAGIDSAWVLTGVDRPSDLPAGTATPTYVITSLDELLEPYVEPYVEGCADATGARCGSARVTRGADGLVVDRGSVRPVEVVRAGLALLLAARDAGEPVERLRRDAEVLDRVLDDAATPNR